MALGVVEAVEEAKADILVVGVDGIGELMIQSKPESLMQQ